MSCQHLGSSRSGFLRFFPIQSSRRICRCLLFLLLRLLFELFGSLFFLWNIERNHARMAVEKPRMAIFLGIIIIASPSASKFSPTEFWLRRSTQETQAPSGYGNSQTQMDGVVMSGVLRPIPCETWSLILRVLGGALVTSLPGAQLILKIPWLYLHPQVEGLDNGFPTRLFLPRSFFSFFDFFSFSWKVVLLWVWVGDEFDKWASFHSYVMSLSDGNRKVYTRSCTETWFPMLP